MSFFIGFVDYAGNLCLLRMCVGIMLNAFATYYVYNYAAIIDSSLKIQYLGIAIYQQGTQICTLEP